MNVDDLGQYCRQVEQHLTRVNGGHLVRIVGPGFDLVRQWADDGIPLPVVFRGIELKAERHRIGASRRPLRIEFCETDVRETFDTWRRATGLTAVVSDKPLPDEGPGERRDTEADDDEPARRVPVSKHAARAIDRLGRAGGRLELPEAMRDVFGATLSELTALRDRARGARGAAREQLAAELAELDGRFITAVRRLMTAGEVAAVRSAAADELASYRSRLAGPRWDEALEAVENRLIRERFGLPTIALP